MQTVAPSVFVLPDEAHLELIKVRDHLRLMTRFVEPGSVALDDCVLHPHALSYWFTTLWRTLDDACRPPTGPATPPWTSKKPTPAPPRSANATKISAASPNKHRCIPPPASADGKAKRFLLPQE